MINFIKECECFFVLTIENNKPYGRPFGAIMENDGCLYISTSASKNVYKQINDNKNIQIVALKQYTRQWIRITGEANVCEDIVLKQKMLEQNPNLKKHFKSATDELYKLIKIIVTSVENY